MTDRMSNPQSKTTSCGDPERYARGECTYPRCLCWRAGMPVRKGAAISQTTAPFSLYEAEKAQDE